MALNEPLPRRREFVQSLSAGLGTVALAAMLAESSTTAAPPPNGTDVSGDQSAVTHSARAKHSIVLFMPGGPSQMDTFDPKPALEKYAGQRPEAANLRTERTTGGLLPSPFQFQRHGEAGLHVSELLPKLAELADDLCVVRSLYTFNPTHGPARSLMSSGNIAATRPSMGAWLDYGLGSENQNLPGFVVLGGGGSDSRSGFLPSKHKGVSLDSRQTDPEKMIRYLKNEQWPDVAQRRQLDLIQELNRNHAADFGDLNSS
ncbi:MAG: DUF1501 domain-containing protein, partial [Planctomycetales bacterium]|nr:DUF1501 domain-containing protein [Planctomycetales bacterium]